MTELARGGWTDKEILTALRGRGGSQQIKFRFDVLRNGAKIKEINATGSVDLNRFADIQRAGAFKLTEELDWLHDEIKPYMLLRMPDKIIKDITHIMPCYAFDALHLLAEEFDALNITGEVLDRGYIGTITRKEQYAEFPLGVFVMSSPSRHSSDGFTEWTVAAYDHTVILKEDSISEPLFFLAGTKYIDAVQSILVSANAGNVFIKNFTDARLPTDREFEIGTTKLSIANSLLGEINFNPIRCDSNGQFLISKYQEPSPNNIEFTYAADELSVISRDTASDQDFYSVPNVFIAVCSNPELDKDYRSVFINDSPTSALSTVSRGRRITSEIYQPSTILSQEALDTYIRRIAFEANQVYEQLTFTTAIMPIHESGNILEIRHPDVTGIFIESSWTIVLSADSQMIHTARRLISI